MLEHYRSTRDPLKYTCVRIRHPHICHITKHLKGYLTFFGSHISCKIPVLSRLTIIRVNSRIYLLQHSRPDIMKPNTPEIQSFCRTKEDRKTRQNMLTLYLPVSSHSQMVHLGSGRLHCSPHSLTL